MEKALAVEGLPQLERFFSSSFQRVYFGSETCEAKIPLPKEAVKAKAFCERNKAGFSLVTPLCTDSGLKRLQALLPLLSREDEVIANDFGVLKEAGKHKAKPVAGRLLNKQFQDPRIASFMGRFPNEMIEHLSLSQASSSQFRKVLSSFRVKRVELDNLLQGIATDLRGTGFSGSLYYPLALVSATRLCLSANAGKISQCNKVGIFECSKECNRFRFSLASNAFPKRLLLVGNALLFENSVLPGKEELASKGIDRLVENRALWPEKH